MLGRIWRWGVVVPVTVLAFAGGIADVVTGTVDYWYLLAPSYFVIAISVWNGLGARSEARRQVALAAVDDAGDETPLTIVAGDPASAEPIVGDERPVTVVSIAGAAWRTFLRVLWTITFTFMAMVLIWMTIAIATWARGYWYIYGPIFAGIAWFVWTVLRSGPADAAEAQQETLVR